MSVAGPLILFGRGVVVGWAELGLAGVAWVQLAMAVGISLLAAYYFQRFFSIRSCFEHLRRPARLREMAHFSFPVMVTDLLYAVLTQLDVLMLGFFVSAEMVGVYALARRIASAMLKAPQAFDPIFSSVVSELAVSGRYGELVSRFRLSLDSDDQLADLRIATHRRRPAANPNWRRQNAGAARRGDCSGTAGPFILSVSMMLQGSFALAEPSGDGRTTLF